MKTWCKAIAVILLSLFSATAEPIITAFHVYDTPLGRAWFVIAIGEPGGLYQIETSADLLTWERSPDVAFNLNGIVVFSGEATLPVQFFRVVHTL